jgi:hypothetical protein
MKMAKYERMYKNSPKLERDADGNLGVKKPTQADAVQSGTDGVPVHVRHAHERREIKHRHVAEHHALHHRHEIEHSHMEGGKKGELHARHHAEIKAMHGRHEGEHREMLSRHEKEHGKDGGKMIAKVESNEKEGV